PVGNDLTHFRIVRVDRLDDREPAGVGALHFHRIAGVVAVHGKGGDEDRAVDPDLVHRRHHLVTRNVIGPVRHTVPGSVRRVRLLGVDVRLDDVRRGLSPGGELEVWYRTRPRPPCPEPCRLSPVNVGLLGYR